MMVQRFLKRNQVVDQNFVRGLQRYRMGDIFGLNSGPLLKTIAVSLRNEQ